MMTFTRLLVLGLGLFAFARTARAAAEFTVPIEVGPLGRAPGSARTLTFDRAVLKSSRRFDVQDGHEHIVRGVTLRELVALAKAPKSVDAAVFSFVDGMQIPVRLADKDEVEAIFIALEHGDPMERYTSTYPLLNKAEWPCPKIVYSRPITTYSIWLYPTQLASIKLVSWKTYEAALAQPTRKLPDRSGWPLYLKHCQACHGIGQVGATRAPDFLSDMEAYRRVPPLAATDVSQHPSLHEKVKGFTEGTMPVLNHVSNAEIATLWRWLHAIHASATK
jgi:hypothetical protein